MNIMRLGSISCMLAILFAGGCVERTLDIDSTPPGALVYLDDQEIGRTPLNHDFLWYAKYDVVIRKEGYETVKTTADVKAPLYEWIPFDLFADLLPIHFKDHHHFTFAMNPQPEVTDTDKLIQNGQDMRGQLESSHFLSSTKP